MGLQKCIFCLEARDNKNFSPEHVIPSAMGGGIVIASVCATCNNDLSKSVDQRLLKHATIAFYRNQFQLTRKGDNRRKSKIPNPFKNTIISNNGHKYRIVFENNKPKPEIIEELSIREDTEMGGYLAKLVLPASKLDQIDELIAKHAKRRGIEVTHYEVIKRGELPTPSMSVSVESSNDDFILGCLKIAYEMTCSFFPDYIQRPIAKLFISSIKTGLLDQALEPLIMKDHPVLMERYGAFFGKIEGLKAYHHAIVIENIPNIGLVCCVRLFNWHFPVIMDAEVGLELQDDSYLFICNNTIDQSYETNIKYLNTSFSLTVELKNLSNELKESIKLHGNLVFEDRSNEISLFSGEGKKIADTMGDFLMNHLLSQDSIPWNASEFKFSFQSNKYFLAAYTGERVNLLGIIFKRDVFLSRVK